CDRCCHSPLLCYLPAQPGSSFRSERIQRVAITNGVLQHVPGYGILSPRLRLEGQSFLPFLVPHFFVLDPITAQDELAGANCTIDGLSIVGINIGGLATMGCCNRSCV